MSSKHRGIMAKEIVDQTLSHFEKKRENLTATQQHVFTEEPKNKPSKRFEPTANFNKVFSETVGKRTRPCVNINLKENPRLINLSQKSAQRNEEDKSEQTAPMSVQESERKPLKKLEPTANFHKVFSEIIGKKPEKHTAI